jgi:hypothetical protein
VRYHEYNPHEILRDTVKCFWIHEGRGIIRRIMDALLGIPAERSRQFQLIERARTSLLTWARAESIPLEHVEYVVPFVETDFSLSAWLFYADESNVRTFESDGTSGRVTQRFQQALAEAGYPAHWLPLVECRFASKEEVDKDYEGSWFEKYE